MFYTFIALCVSSFYMKHTRHSFFRIKSTHLNGLTLQRLDGQVVRGDGYGASVLHGKGQDDARGSGIVGGIVRRVRNLADESIDSVFDLNFRQRKAFRYGYTL